LAYAIYIRKILSAEAFINTVPSLHKFLVNKLYLDDLYQWVIDNVALVLARFIALFDRAVINDVAVNVPANQIRASGSNLRYHITGRVYDYALGVVIGAVAIAVAWWIIAS